MGHTYVNRARLAFQKDENPRELVPQKDMYVQLSAAPIIGRNYAFGIINCTEFGK